MKSAYDASSKCSKTLINRSRNRNPLPIYKLKERVMIRYPFNIGKRAPQRRVAIAGTIIARNIPLSKYNVKYRNTETKVVEKEWVEVTDVTSLTHTKESQRKKLNNVDCSLNTAEREKRLESLFAELTWEERITNEFERVGYLVQPNPAKDGNCQFSALADQLSRHRITNITSHDVRQQVVNYMAEYRESLFNDRPDFETTFNRDRYETFNIYIDMMGRNSTYGDHFKLWQSYCTTRRCWTYTHHKTRLPSWRQWWTLHQHWWKHRLCEWACYRLLRWRWYGWRRWRVCSLSMWCRWFAR